MRGRISGDGDKKRYFLCRPEDVSFVEVTRAQYDEAFPDQAISAEIGGHLPACWPQTSEAAGVHPKQVEEERARCKRLGLGATVNADGTVTFADRAQRREYLRGSRMHDNSGGYGDG